MNLQVEQTGSEIWEGARYTAPIASGADRRLLEDAVARVRRIAEEHDAVLPPKDRLELLAAKAAEAELSFFDAALYEPTKEDMERFFGDFVLRALGSKALMA